MSDVYPAPRGPLETASLFARLVKIEHTVFALPFAYVGALLAVDGIPSAHDLLWITVAMVGARSLAMALNRLIDMGIEPFLVASSVVAVLAQRLIRKVCPDCKQSYQPDDEELIRLGVVPGKTKPTFYRGSGCPACTQTGYRGRTGIHELLVLDDEIRRLIGNKADAAAIRQAAVSRGMVLLKEEAAEKIFAGITTTEEVMRMTQQEVEV